MDKQDEIDKKEIDKKEKHKQACKKYYDNNRDSIALQKKEYMKKVKEKNNTMSDGKKEFSKIYNYVKKNKIKMSTDTKQNLNILHKKWHNKDKTIDDYKGMLENHRKISFDDTESKKLWSEYQAATVRYKFFYLRVKYANITKIEENNVIEI